MAHDLTDRTLRFYGSIPKLGEDDVFGHFVEEGTRFAFAVVRAGGAFHALRCEGYTDSSHDRKTVEYSPTLDLEGVVYAPIAQYTTIEDVEGASYAYDDGTHWHFAHCSPGAHLDFAAEAEAFAVQQFAEAIQTTTAAGALADGNAARNTHHAKATALVKFARLVGRRVHEVVVGQTLGYYHRESHIDHKRLLTADAITRQLAILAQNSAADLASRHMSSRVSAEAAAIRSRLTATHSIETRPDRVNRFYRLSARGQDPLDGVEYIYTASVTETAITGAENLPDAAWKFDIPALATGITRGAYKYFDGYPLTLTPDRPFAIRFNRPASGGAWTQEPAIRIYG